MNSRVFLDSFVDGEGSAKVNGRTWRWEYHDYLGINFVDKRGNGIKEPNEKHPVWDIIDKWIKDFRKSKEAKK